MATIRSTTSKLLEGVGNTVDAAVSVLDTSIKSVRMLDAYVERHLAIQEYSNAARTELGKSTAKDSVMEGYAELTLERARYVSKSESHASAWGKAEEWWETISA